MAAASSKSVLFVCLGKKYSPLEACISLTVQTNPNDGRSQMCQSMCAFTDLFNGSGSNVILKLTMS